MSDLQKMEKSEKSWVDVEFESYRSENISKNDIIVCYSRISSIFNIPPEKIRKYYKFGEDLDASFISDFKRNELDRIIYDIEELELVLYPEKNSIRVSTVSDFVHLFAKCKESPSAGQFKSLVSTWLSEQDCGK